jgi:hypothetical protein
MRISAYARATNPKYANFAVDWAGLAGQLGTKAKGALSTPVGAAKLGAGVGAGVGALNYLGSEDKSIGNLAGQVAGGAALGGAAGYGGSKLKNAWQARKTAQVGKQRLLAPAASTVPQPQTPVQPSNGQPIQTTPPAPQAQLPAAQPIQRPQPIQNGVITTPAPATSGAIVPVTSQSGNSAPQNPVNTKITGAAESERQKMKGVDISGRPNQSVPIEKASGDVRGAQSQAQIKGRAKGQAELLKSYGVDDWQKLPPSAQEMYKNFGKNTSLFANFRVRRYNGFVY